MSDNGEIWINGKFLSQKLTGVQRYCWGVCNALDKMGFRVNIVVNKGIREVPEFGNLHRVGKSKGVFWEQVELPRYLKRHDSPTLINLANTAPLYYGNSFLVIHDVAPLEAHPEWFSTWFRRWYRWLLPRLIRRAHIAAVSEFTAARMRQLTGIKQNYIPILPNGIYFREPVSCAAAWTRNKRYVLCVASHNPRKGLNLLLDAYHRSSLPGQSIYLVIAGSASHHFPKIDKQCSQHVIWKEKVSDGELQSLYQNCLALTMPSVYEGFGLPVLEALYFDKPVLANKLAVFREFFENSIDFVDCSKITLYATSLEKLVSKVQNGRATAARIDEYSFENTARLLLDNL